MGIAYILKWMVGIGSNEMVNFVLRISWTKTFDRQEYHATYYAVGRKLYGACNEANPDF